MPAATLSLRIAYSAAEICGTSRTDGFAFGFGLVGGKLSHCLRDLLRVGHEELFLRRVERHRRDIWSGDSSDGAVQAVESVLGDGGRDLGAEPAREVVFVYDDSLARLPDRLQDRVP